MNTVNTTTKLSNYIQQGRTFWGDGGMHPPSIFFEGGDNAFITPNIGRYCYAIAIKPSMSGDGWQG